MDHDPNVVHVVPISGSCFVSVSLGIQFVPVFFSYLMFLSVHLCLSGEEDQQACSLFWGTLWNL